MTRNSTAAKTGTARLIKTAPPFDVSFQKQLNESFQRDGKEYKSGRSLSKALSVFVRSDECLDHLRIDVITAKAVQLAQPEVIALIIQRRLWGIVRVPSQVTVVLH